MHQRVIQLLAQNPAWNGAEIAVTPLVGGITNQNYRLDIRAILHISGSYVKLFNMRFISRYEIRTTTPFLARD